MRKADQQQAKKRARLRKTTKRYADAHKTRRNEGARAFMERQARA